MICAPGWRASAMATSRRDLGPGWLEATAETASTTDRLTDAPQAEGHGLGVGGMLHGLGPADDLLVVQFEQVLVEPLHPSLAAGDVIAQVAQLVVLDQLGRHGAAPEDFHHRPARTLAGHRQALRDHRLQTGGKLRGRDPPLLRGDHRQDSLDRL